MLTEAVITVLTETVFSHLIEESGVSDKVRGWLKRDPQHLAFQVATVPMGQSWVVRRLVVSYLIFVPKEDVLFVITDWNHLLIGQS